MGEQKFQVKPQRVLPALLAHILPPLTAAPAYGGL